MITTENSNDIYVGSTTLTLKARLQKHECHYRTGIYCSSSEIIKQGNYKIILIKNFACDSKEDLEFEETRFQRDMVCVNKNLARLTDEEKKEYKKQYDFENKNEIREYKKQYYLENKNEINEKNKQYYFENKERLNEKNKQYYLENKNEINEKQKQYYFENKNEIREYQKQYYTDNKQKLTKKFTCECGGRYTQVNKLRHFKTDKHKKYFQD